MQVVDFSDKYADYVAKCTHDDSSDDCSLRAKWLRDAVEKGAVVKVALDDKGEPAGFVQAVPIEWGWYVAGQDLYHIPCICVNYRDVYERKTGKGRGRIMMEALEHDLRPKTKGIAVTALDNDFWFMPYGFFKKLGYKEVVRNGEMVLMIKRWADGPDPVFHSEPYSYKPVPGKVAVDVFWNSNCPTCISDYLNAKAVCDALPGKTVLRAFDNCYGKPKIGRGVYVNGEHVQGQEGDEVVQTDTIRERINSIK